MGGLVSKEAAPSHASTSVQSRSSAEEHQLSKAAQECEHSLLQLQSLVETSLEDVQAMSFQRVSEQVWLWLALHLYALGCVALANTLSGMCLQRVVFAQLQMETHRSCRHFKRQMQNKCKLMSRPTTLPHARAGGHHFIWRLQCTCLGFSFIHIKRCIGSTT